MSSVARYSKLITNETPVKQVQQALAAYETFTCKEVEYIGTGKNKASGAWSEVTIGKRKFAPTFIVEGTGTINENANDDGDMTYTLTIDLCNSSNEEEWSQQENYQVNAAQSIQKGYLDFLEDTAKNGKKKGVKCLRGSGKPFAMSWYDEDTDNSDLAKPVVYKSSRKVLDSEGKPVLEYGREVWEEDPEGKWRMKAKFKFNKNGEKKFYLNVKNEDQVHRDILPAQLLDMIQTEGSEKRKNFCKVRVRAHLNFMAFFGSHGQTDYITSLSTSAYKVMAEVIPMSDAGFTEDEEADFFGGGGESSSKQDEFGGQDDEEVVENSFALGDDDLDDDLDDDDELSS